MQPNATAPHLKLYPVYDPIVEKIVSQELFGKRFNSGDFYYVEVSAAPGAGKTKILEVTTAELKLQPDSTIQIVLDDIVKLMPGYNEEAEKLVKHWKANPSITNEEKILVCRDLYEKYQTNAEIIETRLLEEAARLHLNVVFERNLWITSNKAFLPHSKMFLDAGAKTMKLIAVASAENLKDRIISRGNKIGRLPDYRAVHLINDYTQTETVDNILEFEEIRIFDLDVKMQFNMEYSPQQIASIKGTPHRATSYTLESANANRISELSLQGVLVYSLRNLLLAPSRLLMSSSIHSGCVTCSSLTLKHCPCDSKVRYCNGYCQQLDLSVHQKVCSRI